MGCFDLGEVQTYDTRPMPDDGSKLVNVDVLADAGTQLELELPVASLGRLESVLAGTTGIARARVAFRREQGYAMASIQASADLPVTCQRCLAPFTLVVEGDAQVVLVASDDEAIRVPEAFETVVCPEGRIHPRQLVEEELLLALPVVPLHPQGECGDQPAEEKSPPAAQPVQNPFAMLGEMLGSDHRN